MSLIPLGGRGMIGGALGRGLERASAAWWLSGGITAEQCVVAYQAKGAANYATSLVNLANPGTYNLTTATPPTWTSASGWTSYILFDAIPNLLTVPMTVFWRGKTSNNTSKPFCLSGNVANDGLQMLTWSDSDLYVGFNATANVRFSNVDQTINVDHVFCYQKLANNAQNLWIDNVLVAGSPKGGNLPTVMTFQVGTQGAAFAAAVALYNAAISVEQVAAITAAMAAV